MAEFGVGQASPERLRTLLRLIGRMEHEGRKRVRVLEVGSYEGGSALQWSQGLALLPEGGEVMCIDPWAPYHTASELETDEAYGKMHADLVSGKAFDRFQTNIKEADSKAPIKFFRGTLEGWGGLYLGESFDIVYIDGNHHYASVMHDLKLAQSLVNNGGILCGDDLEIQISPGSPGEVQARENADVDYVNEYHPGVSLAVMETFGLVWMNYGIWAVRKTKFGWRSP